MTNKMLITIVVLIILAGAAIAGYFYWENTKPLRIPLPVAQTSQQPAQDNQQAPTPPADSSSTTPTTEANQMAQNPSSNSGQCVRDFNPSVLAQNGDINIANREVAIDVKNFGTITLEFYSTDAPKTVENFLRLTDAGFYDCLTFHRVAAGFVIQGGDPTGTGTGGESAYGGDFADELNPNTPSYKAGYVTGVLAMANAGPNTNSSQFFILLADHPELPHLYTIFGKVIMGQNVVDKIGQVQTNPPGDGMPVTPVVMQSVKIIK